MKLMSANFPAVCFPQSQQDNLPGNLMMLHRIFIKSRHRRRCALSREIARAITKAITKYLYFPSIVRTGSQTKLRYIVMWEPRVGGPISQVP